MKVWPSFTETRNELAKQATHSHHLWEENWTPCQQENTSQAFPPTGYGLSKFHCWEYDTFSEQVYSDINKKQRCTNLYLSIITK